MASSKSKLKFKCPYCPEAYLRLQSLQPHIVAKHPEFIVDRETDPPANPPEDPKTGNGGETREKEEKVAPEVKLGDSVPDDIEQIKAERDTAIKQKEDLEIKLEAKEQKEEEENRRREKMGEEEISKRLEKIEARFSRQEEEKRRNQQRKEREEQEAKARELEENQLKIGRQVEETGKQLGTIREKLTLVGNMVCDEKGDCRLATKEEIASLKEGIVKDVVTALKPKEEEEPEKTEATGEEKPEKKKEKGILGTEHSTVEEFKDCPECQTEFVDKYLGQKGRERIRQSDSDEEKLNYILNLCTSDECKPLREKLLEKDIKIQKKREGGGMLGGDWEDIS